MEVLYMSKFNNEMYEKGYNDGFSDALNNIDIENILDCIPTLSKEEKQKILKVIENCE